MGSDGVQGRGQAIQTKQTKWRRGRRHDDMTTRTTMRDNKHRKFKMYVVQSNECYKPKHILVQNFQKFDNVILCKHIYFQIPLLFFAANHINGACSVIIIIKLTFKAPKMWFAANSIYWYLKVEVFAAMSNDSFGNN